MVDFGSGLSGAASGAAMGSSFGPWGTAAGGIIGGVAGLFGGGKKKKPKKLSRFDKGQQQLYNDYTAGLRGQGQFADLYNFDANAANQNFDQMYSKPAYRQFQENIIPSITGQYRGGNIMNSTYAGEALSRAGRDVQENLNAQRGNMIYAGSQAAQERKMRGLENVMNMQTFDLQRPQENPNTIDQILSKTAPAAADWFANYLSKPGAKV